VQSYYLIIKSNEVHCSLTEFIFIFNILQYVVTIIDTQIAGIAGDMLLSALVNIGANKSKIIDGVYFAEEFLPGSKIQNIDFQNVKKNEINATLLILELDEKTNERKGIELLDCVKKTIDKLDLGKTSSSFAKKSIETLLNAEATVHGTSTNSTHFHEASSIDTVIDIVGTAIALDDLRYFDDEIIATPIAVGGGTLSFSHGITSNPGSAILEIFKNSQITIVGRGVKDELTTPTGASMIVNLAKKCSEFYPPIKVDSIGYGAGKKDFDSFANVVRIVHGKKQTNYERDSVVVLETNVDDVSGEVIGNVLEKIMKQGAKDVTITPAITKKSRPTNIISVICDNENMNSILDVLTSETGTLGIRVRSSERYVVPRIIKTTTINIQNKKFTIRYKVANNESFKIESDDIKSVSESINRSFKETEELIKNSIKKEL
jgi:pyridinium-3,5-bisthiocarboxylic acid mononucleotide nickel chelatase